LIKLDTNGSFPEILKRAVNEKRVDYVAMDIKNCQEKYALTTGVDSFDINLVKESVDFLKQNKIEYEFRTTITKEYHTLEDIDQIGQWISGAKKYYLQIYVDSGNIIKKDGILHAHSPEMMQKMLEIASKYVKTTELRGM
jgi:pyruvate formate lyase activating enzyme